MPPVPPPDLPLGLWGQGRRNVASRAGPEKGEKKEEKGHFTIKRAKPKKADRGGLQSLRGEDRGATLGAVSSPLCPT